MLSQYELHQQLFTLIKANYAPTLIAFLNRYRGVIDINWKDENQTTVLHQSIAEGRITLTQLLLDHGADVNAVNAEGNTPLHWAIGEEQQQIAELLLNRGANVEAEDIKSRVALHWAVREHNPGLVRLLLSRDADIQSVDQKGNNPFHWAIQERQKSIVELLVEQGADINAADGDGKSPLQLAVTENHPEIIFFLIEETLLIDPSAIKPDFIEEKTDLSLKWDDCARELCCWQTSYIPGISYSIFQFKQEKDVNKLAALLSNERTEAFLCDFISNINPIYARIKVSLSEQLRLATTRSNAFKKLDIFTHDKVYGDFKKFPKEILFEVANYLKESDIDNLSKSAVEPGGRFFNPSQKRSADSVLITHHVEKRPKLHK